MSAMFGLVAVLVLVLANGFFVASEFALVAVRRSRVVELVNAGLGNAKLLQRSVDNLDANLAATQLGITISSLALGWIGEPAIAHLVEPALTNLPLDIAKGGSHAIAVAISFILITALHIVLGELAPKSLALQRSEKTALWVVRPLSLFLLVLRPAIIVLNRMGNLVLRLAGLTPGAGEDALHSPEELKLLIAASHEAGLLHETQHDVAERVFGLGNRRIAEIMTPRLEIDWIDANASLEDMLNGLRRSPHEQMLIANGGLDQLVGVVLKRDMLNQALDQAKFDPVSAARKPLIVHETMPIVRVLQMFKRSPLRVAAIVNEYGGIEGMVTQTDLLKALAGEVAEESSSEPSVVERADGSLLIDGLLSVHEANRWLGWRDLPSSVSYHTVAGMALAQLAHLPATGETFHHNGWIFEIVDMDGRRVDKILAKRSTSKGD